MTAPTDAPFSINADGYNFMSNPEIGAMQQKLDAQLRSNRSSSGLVEFGSLRFKMVHLATMVAKCPSRFRPRDVSS
jgi:hypothetical protein